MADDDLSQTMPIPLVDLDSAPFWEGCNRGELLLQRCGKCGEYRYPPRPLCPTCHSFETRWERASGRGRVYSWVVAHHPVHPLVRDKVPYAILLVELEEGPRMVSRLVGDTHEVVSEGLPVEVVFERIADGVEIPHMRVARDGS